MSGSGSGRDAQAAAGPSGLDLGLYAFVVLAWGTSWLGMRWQVGAVEPEVSVLWRFVIAAPIMFLWAGLARRPLLFPVRDHALFAGMGATMFSTNLILFYSASLAVPSGLMAVVFSLASIFNLALGAVALGQRIEPRLVAAGVIGVAGVALMFAPEIARQELEAQAVVGLIQCVAATLCFCTGNIISAASQRRGLPVLSGTAWGMLYGCIILALVSLARDHPFVVEPTWRYWLSLMWLAIVASVAAFASFLTLVGRIGAARAGYMTVLFPVVALAASTAIEGYRWSLLAVLGLVLVLAGNLIALKRNASG